MEFLWQLGNQIYPRTELDHVKLGKVTVMSSGSRGKNVPGYSTRLLSTGNSGCQVSASQIERMQMCLLEQKESPPIRSQEKHFAS